MPLTLARPTLHRTVLPNGLVVLVIENPVADIIAARVFVRAGTSHEPRSQAGLFALLTSLLTKGSDRLSSMEIAEQVESTGASLSSDASADYSLVSIKTVSADFEPMLALAAHLMRSPAFPEAELELERRLTLQSLRSMQEQPFTVAYNALREALYGEHPYALPGIGTADSVIELTQADLQEAHRTYFRPDNLVIAISGRITPEKAVALVQDNFGDWQPPISSLSDLTYPAVPEAGRSTILPQDTQQAIVMVGYQAPSVKHPDYAALKLLSTYLGNGLSSRLFVELREKRGLAYDVSAFYPTRLGMSQFVVYMGTAPSNVPNALEGLRYETERLVTENLTPEELEGAKNKLLGQYALGKQTNTQLAQLLGWYEVLGLGIDFDPEFQESVAAVTQDRIQAAAQTAFVDPSVVLLGPAAAVEPFANAS
ncbi:M16 family metallopeptidase [Leptolyngbya sp. PCC 6406]|uniref:M16 family metallopeptidase n=1 Tax=Leptolyngbya sp. PCC 6406 TaxID=1173264 RepID=UPI0002ACC3AD|nr:pitrilysin family protein [Leptolyngbya sp. PCC 6406]